MVKGERVPFDGILATPEYLAALTTALEREIATLRAELDSTKAEANTKLAAAEQIAEVRVVEEREKTKACRADATRRDLIFEGAIKECSKTDWFKSPTLWTVIGAAVGAGVCGVGVGLSR